MLSALRPRLGLAATTITLGILLVHIPVARGELVTDPANDFLPTYIGPKNGDMDALSSEVSLNTANNTFTFTATVNGAVGTTTGDAAWVWGLDRGKGTERFLPAFGAGVKFDSVIALFANQTGAFIDLLGSGPPQPQNLPAGSVKVSGNTISATVPVSMIPSEGFAAKNYTWNFWPESILANPPYVSDFAPDARNATLTVVPEPDGFAFVVIGLIAAVALRTRDKAIRNFARNVTL